MFDLFRKIFGKKKRAKEYVSNLGYLKDKFISKDVEENIAALCAILNNSYDIKHRVFKISGSDIEGAVLYIDNLIREGVVLDHILKPLMFESADIMNNKTGRLILKSIKDSMLSGGSIKEVNSYDEIVLDVMSGDTFLCIQGYDTGFIIDSREYEGRNIGEPSIEPSVKGAQEAFVETLKRNIGLIRRRIRDPNLSLNHYTIGRRSKTDIVIASINGIADSDIQKEVRKRILSIDIDGNVEAEQIGELISDNPNSIFPLYQTTERPDKLAAALLEGRVAVLLDGTPRALIVPVTLPMLLQSTDDYFENWVIGSVLRISRYVSMLISSIFPAMYIAISSFNPGMLPTNLALSIASTRSGVPFPAIIEALLMEIILEILQEASVRLPRVVGQTVSIVGGLVIGQAAVQAGIVSPIMVIVIAVTAISCYALPSYSLGLATRLLRVPFMLAAVVFGSYGVSMGLLALLVYLSSLKSFGIRYLSPLSPYRPGDWKDAVIRISWRAMKKRPELLNPYDSIRENIGSKEVTDED
ncbi:MAG TPA: spore germination protein [Clostridiales bacterium]|nr:spore germination protein [Clostridiales bacterium]